MAKRTSIEGRYDGGWAAFCADAPNRTFCHDSYIARFAFQSPVDVKPYVGRLERLGLVYMRDGEAQDIVVVEQIGGVAVPCRWAQSGKSRLRELGDVSVSVCRESSDPSDEIVVPDGWTYERSLSLTFAFVPTEQVKKSLRFIRHESGVDVYFDTLTGDEVLVGRTGEWARRSRAARSNQEPCHAYLEFNVLDDDADRNAGSCARRGWLYRNLERHIQVQA